MKILLYFSIMEEERELRAIGIIVRCEVYVILLANTLLLEYFKMEQE